MSPLTGKRCECCACGERFNSASGFDRHRSGRLDAGEPRRCASPAELATRGWSRNARGFWIERTMPHRPATVRAEGRNGTERMGRAA